MQGKRKAEKVRHIVLRSPPLMLISHDYLEQIAHEQNTEGHDAGT
jgi:hypothetical protein